MVYTVSPREKLCASMLGKHHAYPIIPLHCSGGKKCLKCKERIFHDKWNVHPKLAEERWAHQEARRREVAEVAEFLGFD